MDGVDLVAVALVGGGVLVCRGGCDIVPARGGRGSTAILVFAPRGFRLHSRKWQPVPIPSSSFLGEPLVEQTLIRTVKAPVRVVHPIIAFPVLEHLAHALPVRVAGTDDHDARVEAVRPAGVGACGEGVGFGGFEEVGEGSEGEDVGVEVDEGGEDGRESEEVELGQSEVEVGAACEGISDGQNFKVRSTQEEVSMKWSTYPLEPRHPALVFHSQSARHQ